MWLHGCEYNKCTVLCPLSQFKAITRKILGKNFHHGLLHAYSPHTSALSFESLMSGILFLFLCLFTDPCDIQMKNVFKIQVQDKISNVVMW